MISETQLRELLAQRAESKNIDYKVRLNWDTSPKDEKRQLVKDILAMMNTQDGGYIVLGVEDSALEPVGLREEDFASFDTTKSMTSCRSTRILPHSARFRSSAWMAAD
jgi:predicted HTH transcriptional regulator